MSGVGEFDNLTRWLPWPQGVTVADITKATMVPPGRRRPIDWPRHFWKDRPQHRFADIKYMDAGTLRDNYPLGKFYRWLDSAKPMLTFRERWAYTAGPDTLEGSA